MVFQNERQISEATEFLLVIGKESCLIESSIKAETVLLDIKAHKDNFISQATINVGNFQEIAIEIFGMI